jgi:hypothetical protein
MQWDRSKTIGLAKVSCSFCHGYGLRFVRSGREVPCQCVFRAVFRACYSLFRECMVQGPHTSPVTLDFCSGAEGRRTYSRKREEYLADFCLVSKRSLTAEEHRIFRIHFLLGADWRLCCRQLRMDRGNLFHFIYRIEHKLGRVFAELRPYALFPLDEYFSSTIRREPETFPPTGTFPPRPVRPAMALPLSA